MRHSNCSGMCNKKILRLDRKIEMKTWSPLFSDKRNKNTRFIFDKEPSIIHVDNFQYFHRKNMNKIT